MMDLEEDRSVGELDRQASDAQILAREVCKLALEKGASQILEAEKLNSALFNESKDCDDSNTQDGATESATPPPKAKKKRTKVRYRKRSESRAMEIWLSAAAQKLQEYEECNNTGPALEERTRGKKQILEVARMKEKESLSLEKVRRPYSGAAMEPSREKYCRDPELSAIAAVRFHNIEKKKELQFEIEFYKRRVEREKAKQLKEKERKKIKSLKEKQNKAKREKQKQNENRDHDDSGDSEGGGGHIGERSDGGGDDIEPQDTPDSPDKESYQKKESEGRDADSRRDGHSSGNNSYEQDAAKGSDDIHNPSAKTSGWQVLKWHLLGEGKGSYNSEKSSSKRILPKKNTAVKNMRTNSSGWEAVRWHLLAKAKGAHKSLSPELVRRAVQIHKKRNSSVSPPPVAKGRELWNRSRVKMIKGANKHLSTWHEVCDRLMKGKKTSKPKEKKVEVDIHDQFHSAEEWRQIASEDFKDSWADRGKGSEQFYKQNLNQTVAEALRALAASSAKLASSPHSVPKDKKEEQDQLIVQNPVSEKIPQAEKFEGSWERLRKCVLNGEVIKLA